MRRLILTLLLMITTTSKAAVLEVQHGWGEVDRSGRWEPVFVTASDPTPRNVTLEIVCADEKGAAGIIRQQFAIGPEKRTYPLFVPVEAGTWQRTVVVLRDAQTEKMLAQFPSPGAAVQPAAPFNGNLIGISGRPATLTTLDEQMKAVGLQSGYLEPRRLPRAAIGYDALDVLLLNQPDLAALEDEQQRAIVSWVRAGGSLLFVPGGQAVPPGSLAEALPRRVGPITTLDLSADEAKATGLEPRATRLAARTLEPKPHTDAIPLFAHPGGFALAGRVGLGNVVVSPIDLTGLRFSDPAHLAAFWRLLLADSLQTPSAPSDARAAVSALGQPAALRRDACPLFGTWELVVVCMLLVIGPVDALVFRSLGGRPWQISTACGFAGLIGLAVLVIVQRFTPNESHGTVIRLTDEADNQAVAVTELVSDTASGFSQSFLGTSPDQWWQSLPAPAADAPPADVSFHQTSSGNVPGPGRLAPSNSLYMLGERFDSSPPPLEVSLSVLRSNGSTRITGSLRNLGNRPIRSIVVQTSNGTMKLSINGGGSSIPASLAPGQTVVVDTPAAPVPQPMDSLVLAARQLTPRRSRRIDRLLASHHDLACIYAELEPPASAGAWQDEWVRALVKVAVTKDE